MSLKKNIIAFLVIGVLGTVWHFGYDWSGDNSFLGMFFPVSESVWEHLKLIFYPTLIYSVFEYLFSEEKPQNYLPATAFSIYCGMFTIVLIYYLANGILGFDVSFINIASYYVGVAVMLCKKRKYIKSGRFYTKNVKSIAGALLFLSAFLFAVWSFTPPTLGIFTPPV